MGRGGGCGPTPKLTKTFLLSLSLLFIIRLHDTIVRVFFFVFKWEKRPLVSEETFDPLTKHAPINARDRNQNTDHAPARK